MHGEIPLTQAEIDQARAIILECAALDFISGKCRNKGDRHFVYERLCKAAGLLLGSIEAKPASLEESFIEAAAAAHCRL
jgi:hypothetical protein